MMTSQPGLAIAPSAPRAPVGRGRRWLVAVALATTIVATALPAGRSEAFTTVSYTGAGRAPRIGIIGDSANAGIRWTNSYGPLRRFNFVYDAESCRRTTAPSCRGREGYAPPTALSTLRRLSGQWGSVLVMATGYNDPGYLFGSSVDAIMAEAISQGIPKVMWMTMRTADVSYVSPQYRTNSFTFRDNNRILLQKAQQYGGRLVIADWASYSAGHSEWFYGDGIHYRPSGGWAAAEFIASQAARVLAGENVTFSSGSGATTWPSVRNGSRGSAVATVQQALIDAGYSINGGADGVFGSFTEAAVRQFQQNNGLPVTGVVDANTAIRLGVYDPSGIPSSTGWPELRMGVGGRAVAAAQQALLNRGVAIRGGASGVFGIDTFYAVQTFQRYNGLAITGVIDAATARKLGLFSGSWGDLRRGVTGSRVRAAQQALMNHGVYVRGGATGVFDVYTYYAVQTFQRGQGLPATGVIDGETARRLEVYTTRPSTDVWKNLATGLVGVNVTRAQQALLDRGVVVRGGTTGRFDVYTYYAVRTFQRYNGLVVTGVIDVATARALGLFDLADPAVAWAGLRQWSAGPDVARAQQAMIAKGVYVRNGATGRFDIYTFYAVKTFQRYNGLVVTGVIDVATARKLGLFDATTMIASAATAASAVLIAGPTSSTTTTTTTTSTTATTTSTTIASSLTEGERGSTSSTTEETEAPSTTLLGSESGTIGDLIWFDANLDGRQDLGEAGVPSVVVRLLNDADVEIASTTSDLAGRYQFTDVAAGFYRVEIELPIDRSIASFGLGFEDDVDSDAVEVEPNVEVDGWWIARTKPFVVDDSAPIDTVDIGLVPRPADEPAPPTETVASAPSTTGAPAATEPTPPTEPATSTPVSEPPTTITIPPTTASPTTAAPTTPPTTATVVTDSPTTALPAPTTAA